jgi:hypothetical protein
MVDRKIETKPDACRTLCSAARASVRKRDGTLSELNFPIQYDRYVKISKKLLGTDTSGPLSIDHAVQSDPISEVQGIHVQAAPGLYVN